MRNLHRILALVLVTVTLPAAVRAQGLVSLINTIDYRYVTSDKRYADYRAVFSPDDTQLVFEHPLIGSGFTPLYLVPVNGGAVSSLLPVTIGFSSTRAAWSKVSNMIAFNSQDNDGSQDLYTVRPDGRELIKITSPQLSHQINYPHWYPDGKTIAVADYAELEVKKVVPKPGFPGDPTVTEVTNPAIILTGEPSVSPDGRYIALAAQLTTGQVYNQDFNSIFIYDSQDGSVRLFDEGQGRAPSWSPDGKWITFESNRLDPITGSLCIFAKAFPDGDVLYQLTPEIFDAQHVSWSNDGAQLVVSSSLDRGAARGLMVFAVPLQMQSAANNLRAYARYEYGQAGAFFAAGQTSDGYLAYANYFYYLYLADAQSGDHPDPANLNSYYENLANVYFLNYRAAGQTQAAYAWYDYIRSFETTALAK